MKTPEEVLKDLNITPETKYHSWEYVYDCFIDIINKTRKESWNEAVEACANEITNSRLVYMAKRGVVYREKEHYNWVDGMRSMEKAARENVLKLKK